MDEQLPSLSVIVPVSRQTNDPDACIRSILTGNFSLQVLLVDGGGDAGTVCDRWALADSRVTVIHQAHSGVSVARNAGLTRATGDYVAFADSDGEADPSMYAKLLRLAAGVHADVALCGIARLRDGGVISPVSESIRSGRFLPMSVMDSYILPLLGQNPTTKDRRTLHTSACRGVYRREFLLQSGIAFAPVPGSEDLLFNLDVFSAARVLAAVSEPLYRYRGRPEQIAAQFYTDRLEAMKTAVRRIAETAARYGIPEREYQPRLAWRFLESVNAMARLVTRQDPHRASGILKVMCDDTDVREALTRIQRGVRPAALSFFCGLARRKLILPLAAGIRLYDRMNKDR